MPTKKNSKKRKVSKISKTEDDEDLLTPALEPPKKQLKLNISNDSDDDFDLFEPAINVSPSKSKANGEDDHLYKPKVYNLQHNLEFDTTFDALSPPSERKTYNTSTTPQDSCDSLDYSNTSQEIENEAEVRRILDYNTGTSLVESKTFFSNDRKMPETIEYNKDEIEKPFSDNMYSVLETPLLNVLFNSKEVPKNVMHFLFEVASYEPDHHFATLAYRKIIEFASRKPFVQLNFQEDITFTKEASKIECVLGYKDFLQIFSGYGCDIGFYQNEDLDNFLGGMNQRNDNLDLGEPEFPTLNFALVLKLLQFFVKFYPQEFTVTQVQLLLQLLVRFCLDPVCFRVLPEIEATIVVCLNFFDEENWLEDCAVLCGLFVALIVCDDHREILKIVSSIPLVSPRSQQFRITFAYYEAQRLIFPHEEAEIITNPQVEKIAADLEKIDSDEINIEELETVISLVDITVVKIHNANKVAINKLIQALKKLSRGLKEVAGLNSTVTPVKDLIALLDTKYTMLLGRSSKPKQSKLFG